MTTTATALRVPCATPQAAKLFTALLAEDGVAVRPAEGREAVLPLPRDRGRARYLLQRAVDAGLASLDAANTALREYDRSVARARVGAGR